MALTSVGVTGGPLPNAPLLDALGGTARGQGEIDDYLSYLFGSAAKPDEIPITGAREAYRDYARQLQLQNDYSGLAPGDSRRVFEQAFGGDAAQTANSYGLNRGDVYTAQTRQVSPFTQNQRRAQDANLALGSSPLDPAYQGSVDAVSGQTADPYNQYQRVAGGIFGGVAGNPGSTRENQAAAVYGQTASGGNDPFARNAGVGADYLANAAAGGFVGSNPYIDSAFSQAAGRMGENFSEHVMPGIDARFSASGRYGSDAMQKNKMNAADLYGEQVTDLATNLYGGAYNQERALQQGAAQSLGGLYGQGVGQQLQAAGGMADIAARQRAAQLQAGGQLADLGGFGQDQQLQAATLAPALADAQFQAQLGRNNVVAGVGDQQRQLLDQLLGRAGQYYNTQVGGPTEDVQNLVNMQGALGFTGPDAMGGATGQVQQSRGASAAGGALSGAALGASVGGPWGAAIGGGLGLLGGLL
jgi:hypothetical protein